MNEEKKEYKITLTVHLWGKDQYETVEEFVEELTEKYPCNMFFIEYIFEKKVLTTEINENGEEIEGNYEWMEVDL